MSVRELFVCKYKQVCVCARICMLIYKRASNEKGKWYIQGWIQWLLLFSSTGACYQYSLDLIET